MYSAKFKGLDSVIRALDGLQSEVEREITLAMTKGLLLLEKSSKQNVRTNKSINFGQMVNSISFQLGLLSGGILLGWVLVGADYGKYVEYGTYAHWIPIAPLKLWAKRKLGDENLAYPIQKWKSKQPTMPKPFLFPALEENRDRIIALFAMAVKIAVAKVKMSGY